MCPVHLSFTSFIQNIKSNWILFTPLLKHTIRLSYTSGTQQMEIPPAELNSAPVYQSTTWKKPVFH